MTGKTVVGDKLSGAEMQGIILERTIWDATYEIIGVKYLVARKVCALGE